MSHPHDPYRRPEPIAGPQPSHDGREGEQGDGVAASTSGENANPDPQPSARKVAAVAAPISWERADGQIRNHAWAAPDPFAAAAERPAPPAPVLESDVRPLESDPNHASDPVDEPPAAAPSLVKSAPVIDSEQPAPMAFPDPVPAPVSQPSREQAPQQPEEPKQPWIAEPEPRPQESQPPREQLFQQQPPQEQPTAEPAGDDDEEALTIGRGKANSIVLDDMLVSRHHVRITADDEGLVLQDLGSRNGTYVNGERVDRVSLHEGDRLGIGATTFEVRDGWLVSV